MMLARGDRMSVLFVVLVLLGLADWVLTVVGLSHGGSEVNPVAARVFEVGGPVAALLLKVGALLVFFLMVRKLGERDERFPGGEARSFLIMRAAVAGYAGVVTFGVMQMGMQGA